MAPDKPILCNEDSPCISRLDIAYQTHTSWGHYDNFTKQEPPCDWSITKGQDFFFARRMAASLGITLPELPLEEQVLVNRINGGTRKLTNYGHKWANFQTQFFESNSQPFYVLLDSEGKIILSDAVGYEPDEDIYAQFLECGLTISEDLSKNNKLDFNK